MNIRTVILGAVALSACQQTYESTGNCDAEQDVFDLQIDIEANLIVQEIVQRDLSSYQEVDCNLLCNKMVRETYGWQTTATNSCSLSFSISEEIDSSAEDYDPEATVGTLSCTGEMTEYFCMGRRPLGHIELHSANHFAQCAHLEAASVDAFVELHHALSSWGAPAELLKRVQKAAALGMLAARFLAPFVREQLPSE